VARAGRRPRWLAAVGIVALAMTPLAPAGAQQAPLRPSASSYLLELDGRPVRAHRIDDRLPAGSLSKLLVALVLLDGSWNGDAWIRVSASAASVAPTRLGLRAGEEIPAGAALAAMLIRSANDACTALVESSGLDRPAFMARMNGMARSLGMRDSHFVEPCGYDAPGQYSTARDLLILAKAAHGRPLIALLAAQSRASLETRGGRRIEVASTNLLLGSVEGAAGLKTGYTAKAGPCLIALVERGGHRAWLVLLNARDRWWDAQGLIDAGFAAIR
jgi:D-alanyl-D-alanine carboxypeptidase (penicillin-binding protein 5/6)